MIRFLPFFLYCGTLLAQAQPAGQSGDIPPPSRQLIGHMAEAGKKLNYEGVFVFIRSERMDVMRVLHKADIDGEREKIVSLTGPAREIIRNNHTVTCVFPDTRQVMIERSRLQGFPAQVPEQIEALTGYYQIDTVASERIAGRNTWEISITPKDDFRYGYRLWIDRDTSLLLKSELRDETGAALEVAMFTQLQLHDSLQDELFAPSIKGKKYTWYQYNAQIEKVDATGTPDDDPWRVTWLPGGFRLNVQNEKSSGDYLQHMIYSDGVSMVSIFIEKLSSDAAMQPGAQKIGGVNVYARTAGEYQVTAVGDVPPVTVMRMVDSVVAGR